MNKQRISIIGISATCFLGSAVAAVLFALHIQSKSAVLYEQVSINQQATAQQTELSQINRIYKETEESRNRLDEYFVDPEIDSIDFLNYVEDLARTSQVQVESLSPQEVEREEWNFLVVQYELSGSKERLDQFVRLLELLPFVSRVAAITLFQESAVRWSADVTIEVHVK